jgi:hypothetical protein
LIVFENFLDYLEPSNTFAPIEFLNRHQYKVFVPTLNFNRGSYSVAATYGSDYNSLFEIDSAPRLGLVELHSHTRFLFARQLNLFAVSVEREDEISNLIALTQIHPH